MPVKRTGRIHPFIFLTYLEFVASPFSKHSFVASSRPNRLLLLAESAAAALVVADL